jgi:hypothetical protein
VESRAARVVSYNRPAEEGGTLFGRTEQGASEFGNRLGNLCDLVKNWLTVQLHTFENFSEKANQFNAVLTGYPSLRP